MAIVGSVRVGWVLHNIAAGLFLSVLAAISLLYPVRVIGMKRAKVPIRSLAEVERHHIEETLWRLDGHIGKAAEALGIDRKTLRLKLRQYSGSGNAMG